MSFLSPIPDVMPRSISRWGLNDWVGLLIPLSLPFSGNSVRHETSVSSLGVVLLIYVLPWNNVVDFAFFFAPWMKLLSSDSSLVFLCVTSEWMPSTRLPICWALVTKAPARFQTWKFRRRCHIDLHPNSSLTHCLSSAENKLKQFKERDKGKTLKCTRD